MSMTVEFKKYTGNPKKIHKTFAATYTSKTINPTDFYEDQQPQLILAYDATLYANANYCVIGSDYYFIRDRGLDTGNRMIFFLEKDLLMTIKDELMNVEVIADRSSNLYNSYMNDPVQARQANYETINYQFYHVGAPSPVGAYGHGRLVLVTIGGRTS